MKHPYNQIDKCCGCKACESICPVNAITMELDSETFWYPVIDEDKCIGCNWCKTVCNENFNEFKSIDFSDSYIGKNVDNDVVNDSSSAGAFSALCSVFLKRGFSICGVVNSDMRVYHDIADNIDDCIKFRRSKYVQSDTSGIYELILQLLLEDKKVVFSGVSCQCASLYNFLKINNVSTTNLFVINILCHGVPSQKVFFDYLRDEKIVDYKFRYKHFQRNGKINSKTVKLTMKNGKTKVLSSISDPFMRAYSTRLFYRPSCGVCKYACSERFTDITIADAWGAEKIDSNFNAMSGLSLIMLNSIKAKQLYSEIEQYMSLKKVDNDWVVNSQPMFLHPTTFHPSRSRFFVLYPQVGLRKAVNIIERPSLYSLLKDYIKLHYL